MVNILELAAAAAGPEIVLVCAVGALCVTAVSGTLTVVGLVGMMVTRR